MAVVNQASDLNITTNHLQHLEDSINVNCINSSDFVVGKQFNFNDRVTIINYSTPEGQNGHEEDSDRVVIKDRVLTSSAASALYHHADPAVPLPPGPFKTTEPPNKSLPAFIVRQTFCKVPLFGWILGAVVVVGCVIAIIFQLSSTVSVVDKSESNPSYMFVNGSDGSQHALLKREQWGGLPPFSNKTIPTPVPYVVVSHSASSMCYEEDTCRSVIRNMQKDQMAREYADIAYNFLVGGDGRIYEGRGFKTRNTINGRFESKNIDINFIGDFSKLEEPTFPQIQGVKALIQYGVLQGFIAADYILLAANSTYSTLSPGRNVYKIIKQWDHFETNPDNDESLTPKMINGTDGMTYLIFSKPLWGGVKPKSTVEIELPVKYVVISHTAGGTCFEPEKCMSMLRSIQQFQMKGDYADISYSFMVGGEGNIYKGRSWFVRSAVGSFANNHNIDINFLGDFSLTEEPTEAQLHAVQALIEEGLSLGMISANYSLIAANTTYPTLSPGRNVYKNIKTWKNFDPDPVSHLPAYKTSTED